MGEGDGAEGVKGANETAIGNKSVVMTEARALGGEIGELGSDCNQGSGDPLGLLLDSSSGSFE